MTEFEKRMLKCFEMLGNIKDMRDEYTGWLMDDAYSDVFRKCHEDLKKIIANKEATDA